MASDHPELRRIEIDRANRVKWLRNQLDRSRRHFALHHKIPASSMQSWEDTKGNGLTEKGCLQLIEAFRDDGIRVTIEWLMYGLGPEPTRTTETAQPVPVSKAYCPDDNRIDDALQHFNEQYANPIDMRMPDDSMEPAFRQGDYMAGQRLFQDKLRYAIGQDCIVQTETGHVLVRRVERSRRKGHYRLVAYNPADPADEDTEHRLFSAAPIVWHYRVFNEKLK